MTTRDRSVSLVLPIRNEAEHIDACLRSVRKQDYPADLLEIIVVDGDSDDGTREIVASHSGNDPRIRLLDNPMRETPEGLNIGIRAATGTFVGSVIGHSILPTDYVSAAVAALERTAAWGVGGRMVRRAATPKHRAIAIATSSRIGIGDSTHNYSKRSGWSETAFPGFWRRDVFDAIGFFDPQMLVNEDNELSHRIRKSGGRIWHEASIEIGYVPRMSFAALFNQYRRYALGKMRVLRKHHGGLRWRHFVPASWIFFVTVGGAAAMVFPPWRLVWAAGLALYVVVVLASSARLSDRNTPWWLVAAALVTLHASYGLGTWQGVMSWFVTTGRSGQPVPPSR